MRSTMMHEIGHSGAWQLAILTIIIASWVLYLYFAPDNWREWASNTILIFSSDE
jgi:hypothetical protein